MMYSPTVLCVAAGILNLPAVFRCSVTASWNYVIQIPGWTGCLKPEEILLDPPAQQSADTAAGCRHLQLLYLYCLWHPLQVKFVEL
jgi:hypothetical protein